MDIAASHFDRRFPHAKTLLLDTRAFQQRQLTLLAVCLYFCRARELACTRQIMQP